MVRSKLDNSINYFEMRKVRLQDNNMDATMYEYDINEIPLEIALGNVDNTFVDKGVMYITVYLVYNNEIVSQIGVFEFLSDSYVNLIDEENDIDLSLLDEPLLFSFVTKDFLKKYVSERVEEEETVEEEMSEEQNQEEEEEDVFDEPQPTVYDDLTEKEIEGYIDEEEELTDTELDIDPDNWVVSYMKNKKYGIVDNEGGGECLFAVIRDAFKGIGKKVSIAKMRNLLAENLQPSVYETYKVLYDSYNSNVKEILEKSKKVVGEFKTKRKMMDTEESSDAKLVLQGELKELKKQNESLKEELQITRENMNEVAFMKDIDSIDDLREKIKKCQFWADSWAIHLLEKILKIKIVVFNSSNYEYGDSENVLQCGVKPDETEILEPKYYVLTSYSGSHYMLITYNNKSIFTYKDLPKNIKKLIVTKCMEKDDGIYGVIPEFSEYKRKLQEKKQGKTEEKMSKTLQGNQEDKPGQPDILEEIVEEINEPDLYSKNEGTVFQFYAKSTGKPYPGKGAGETIKPEFEKKYKTLTTIKDWRKKLSNFDNVRFSLDGHTWNSVEHYYQANKFKRNNPEFYKKFTAESESEISKDPAMAKAAGSKTGKFKKIVIRPKEVVADFDFFEGKNADQVMERAMRAKFSQDEASKRTLLETKDAKLNHFSRGSPPVTFYNLMKVRKELK